MGDAGGAPSSSRNTIMRQHAFSLILAAALASSCLLPARVHAAPDYPVVLVRMGLATFLHPHDPSDMIAVRFYLKLSDTQQEEEERQVVAWGESHGLQVIRTLVNHLAVDMRGTVGQFNTLFQIRINDYLTYNGSVCGTRTFYAPATPPVFDDTIAPLVGGVQGIETATLGASVRWGPPSSVHLACPFPGFFEATSGRLVRVPCVHEGATGQIRFNFRLHDPFIPSPTVRIRFVIPPRSLNDRIFQDLTVDQMVQLPAVMTTTMQRERQRRSWRFTAPLPPTARQHSKYLLGILTIASKHHHVRTVLLAQIIRPHGACP